MRSVIVVGESNLINHGGEFYDCILNVEDCPTTYSISLLVDQIRMAIRNEWHEDENSPDRFVYVTVDAHPALDVVILSLKQAMMDEEKIEIRIKD